MFYPKPFYIEKCYIRSFVFVLLEDYQIWNRGFEQEIELHVHNLGDPHKSARFGQLIL